MAKRTPAKKAAPKRAKGTKKGAKRTPRKAGARAGVEAFPPVAGAKRMDRGGVRLDIGVAGRARVKRVIYPPGFRWSVHMKPVSKTDLCMHAHVGYLEAGAIRIEFPDGFTQEFVAPAVVAIEPGHDGGVIGRSPAVLIEFDFKGATADRLDLPVEHGQR